MQVSEIFTAGPARGDRDGRRWRRDRDGRWREHRGHEMHDRYGHDRGWHWDD